MGNNINIKKHVVENAKVTIYAPKPVAGRCTYRNCQVEENGNKVDVIPQTVPNYVRNTKVYECGRTRVMTRKDGSYMLYHNIVAELEESNVDALMTELREAVMATLRHNKNRKEAA